MKDTEIEISLGHHSFSSKMNYTCSNDNNLNMEGVSLIC
jgi:hypothetical protein